MAGRWIAVMVLVVLCGCSTYPAVRARNRTRLNQLSLKMSKPDVLKIMGTNTERINGIFFPVDRITNPYRTESLTGTDSTQIDVLYYYTDQKASIDTSWIDGRSITITDDELTPLVFHDGKLIGWGWRALEDVKAKYEIRMR